MDSKQAQRETAGSGVAGSWGSCSGGCIQWTKRGNAEWAGEREEGLAMCRGVCEGSVAEREGGQREDLDSVSGVARVTVMGTSRGLMEERWKQWRPGKKDGKEVMGLGAFCGKYLD